MAVGDEPGSLHSGPVAAASVIGPVANQVAVPLAKVLNVLLQLLGALLRVIPASIYCVYIPREKFTKLLLLAWTKCQVYDTSKMCKTSSDYSSGDLLKFGDALSLFFDNNLLLYQKGGDRFACGNE